MFEVCMLHCQWGLGAATYRSARSFQHTHSIISSLSLMLTHSAPRSLCSCTILSVSNTRSSLFLLSYISLTLSSPLHCLHNTTLSCSHAHYEQKIHTHIALHTPPNVETRTVHLCRPKINQLVNKRRKTGCTCSVMDRLPIAHELVGADLPECFN